MTTKLHERFVPNLIIYGGEQRPSWLKRAWPTILSWTIGATSALAAFIAYKFLVEP